MKINHAQFIKQEAKRLGFLACGIAKAEFLAEEAPRLENWLQQGFHGEMQYMENHFDMRLDPRLLVENAKSVISLSYNYYPAQLQNKESYKISKYAYGEDYHQVIKEKLRELLASIQQEIGEVAGRCFVDSAPVLERAWAEKAGLGWNGKHSLLIEKQQGSFFFLAELIVDLKLEYDQPTTTNHCGSCTKCIDACPTAAILPNNTVDASKCISYFTIELKENIPSHFKNQFQDWIFGCDICQDVCPWNRFSKAHNEPLFHPNEEMLQFTKRDWEEITKETFQKVFKKSAVKRTKFSGLHRNIRFLKD
ncbi:MAG: tRNA epoxyqueuosine(34) reductase QueG [Flavobacteriia bacterium]|nr:tRNA epoxyqueuosine(34) reductase QueG [Flavobacteriia bacterium]OIP48157.1 MAG: tRNA epoxyqueuosine(34) reductase QueG [Flavobacteriaceae bacterium CG2_30_31_66]PIV97863.1 MAG: tRNA epoxyqueuosine(34) reductase QueG [Flavobacteriaceae bacterium CG17_big_fil_post_rev_8_21_14_2_50_31_13]PIX11379.1 MAG: tRNA epoxyqueuosine(34) reductase QueG [Flavobacteriaceae bacterium CG_4_8_14_3_um_filter_31_8]PIY14604.1 MAG: tRNA epoxyqueuosine(34) reductase QueG [Flavobacteriaceae bacterium CG_4_10_14_3_u